LNHLGGVGSGMDMDVKLALTDRAISLDTDALKEHQVNRRGFLWFSFSKKCRRGLDNYPFMWNYLRDLRDQCDNK
jgi:hypothetical protein